MKRIAIVLLALVACTQAHVQQQSKQKQEPPKPVMTSPILPGTGTLIGTVQAKDGSVLPGVTVILSNTSGGSAASVTDVNGRYKFVAIAPGTYSVKAELAGYGSTFRAGLQVADGRVAEVTATLNPSVSESITVTAEAPLVDVRKTAATTTVSMNELSPPNRAQSKPKKTEMEKVPTSRDPWIVTQSAPAVRVDGVNVGGSMSGQHSVVAADSYAPTINDAPKLAENAYKAAQKEPVTTFSIDVDKASYANVRRALMESRGVSPDAVRIEEMVNYFTYNYPQPNDGRPLAVSSEVTACPWEPSHRLMRIGIQAKTLDQWKLAPNNLVFLIDVSGSMSPPDRLPLIQSSLHLLVDQLRATDSVAIVVYASASGLVLPRTSGADKATINAAIDNLRAGGSTAGGAGIQLAYKVARDNFQKDGNNRVILATDGDFNVGVSSFSDLTKLIETERTHGIYLTCLGVGVGDMRDEMIEMLADKGNGNYYYLDSIKEAQRVFQHQLQGTLVSVADDVKVQLEFNPATVASYRQIGYENRALANEDFTNDAKDAGELGCGESVTVLYEIEPAQPRTLGQMATLKIRYKDPGATTSQEIAAAITDQGKSVYEASVDTQFAAAVAEFGMLLRNSPNKEKASWADVAALARAMRGQDIEGYREELARMIETGRATMGDEKVARK